MVTLVFILLIVALLALGLARINSKDIRDVMNDIDKLDEDI